jgi:hypothetical protein
VLQLSAAGGTPPLTEKDPQENGSRSLLSFGCVSDFMFACFSLLDIRLAP